MYNQGDILLVPIPFTDLSLQKKRPVLVISRNEYNNVADDVIVVAITSHIDGKQYNVPLTNGDMEDGMLIRDSCIRADKFTPYLSVSLLNGSGE